MFATHQESDSEALAPNDRLKLNPPIQPLQYPQFVWFGSTKTKGSTSCCIFVLRVFPLVENLSVECGPFAGHRLLWIVSSNHVGGHVPRKSKRQFH